MEMTGYSNARYQEQNGGFFTAIGRFFTDEFDMVHVEYTSGHKPPHYDACMSMGEWKPKGVTSWSHVWELAVEKYNVGWPQKCCVFGCMLDATVGAHMFCSHKKQNRASWYIVPTCSECNSSKNYGRRSPLKQGTLCVKVVHGKIGWNQVLIGKFDPKTMDERIRNAELRGRDVPRSIRRYRGWKTENHVGTNARMLVVKEYPWSFGQTD